MYQHFALLCALLAMLALPCGPAPADDPPARFSPVTTYRTLTWDDFPVNDTASGLSAQTETFLRYAMQAEVNGRRGKYTARIRSLTFTGGMDRAGSWRRSSVPATATLLLRHEQGHLAINELKRRQLQRTPLSTFSLGQGATPRAAYDNLVLRLRQWYQPQLAALTADQNRYDKETLFGTHTGIQDDWSARLDNALAAP